MNCVMLGIGFTILSETPCAEPHAGCCGGWRLETSGYPILCELILAISLVTVFLTGLMPSDTTSLREEENKENTATGHASL